LISFYFYASPVKIEIAGPLLELHFGLNIHLFSKYCQFYCCYSAGY